MLAVYSQGLILGFSLIVAIGAQNALVLKNGVQGTYPFWTAAICSFGDILLISLGIGGLGMLIAHNPMLMNIAKWGGSAYLIWLAFSSFQSSLTSKGLIAKSEGGETSFKKAMATVLMVTFMNPHVYLDTVVLLGSIGAQYPDHSRMYFAAGTMSAGIAWFFSLSMAGRLLSPILSKPLAWRIMNALIGILLIYVAWTIISL